MEFLNNLFLPPSADHLHLMQYIVILIYFIHIPFISLLIGGSALSVIFRLLSANQNNSLYYQVSKDFVETLVFRKTAGVFMGVLPLVVLSLVEGQIFYDAQIDIVPFMLYTTIIVAIGISLIYFYQYTFRNNEISFATQLLSGGLGLLFLIIGYFIFSASTALILDPGQWYLVNSLSDLLYNWSVIARFLHFLTAAFAVSGAAMLFFFFNWNESRRDVEPEYADYMRRLNGGITITFIILQPIFLFWNLTTMPDLALSMTVFILSAVVLLLILTISLSLYRLLAESKIILGNNIFILFITVFLVMIVNDHIARDNAISNHTELLTTRAKEVEEKLRAEREPETEKTQEVDLALGEEVYNNQCISCHRFDQKIVGPPYKEVLPKYEEDREALINFIRNPEKINPDYPPMPNLGLSEKKVRSVAAYLLKKYEEEK